MDSSYIGFCYDSAHDQIGGPRSFKLIVDLRSRLVAVHLSDRVKEFVDHGIPGDGFIHWDELCLILNASLKDFPVLMEVVMANCLEKDPVEFLRLVFERGCKLYRQIYTNQTI